MRQLYNLALWLLLPWVLLRLWWRGRDHPGYRQRWQERFGWIPKMPAGGIWLHAVSVGELQAAVPLIRLCLQQKPQIPLLITTTTPTASARLQTLFGAELAQKRLWHRYAPYDLPWIMQRFLRLTQPCLAIVVETEVWPNWLTACHHAKIPMVLINARLSKRSARRYAVLGRFSRQLFKQFHLVVARDRTDAARLRVLGVPPARLHLYGDLKYDLSLPADRADFRAHWHQQWGVQRPVWIAASTHPGEEQQLVQVHQQLRQHLPDALLILVPRHPERSTQLLSELAHFQLQIAQRSAAQSCNPTTAILLVDTLGELLLWLATADVAFIGGSLVPHGGHNPLEPAALGLPILFGSWMFNFAQLSQQLLRQGAAYQVRSSDQLVDILQDWLCNAELRHQIGAIGRHWVQQHQGASLRVWQLLQPLCDRARITDDTQ